MKKVIVIDDDPSILKLVELTLAGLNINTICCKNTDIGFKNLKRQPFDLLLLDVNMPGCSGFEFAEFLKKQPILDKLPIVFLTQRNKSEDITRALSLGAIGYIVKPFTKKDLGKRVQALLKKHEFKLSA